MDTSFSCKLRCCAWSRTKRYWFLICDCKEAVVGPLMNELILT